MDFTQFEELGKKATASILPDPLHDAINLWSQLTGSDKEEAKRVFYAAANSTPEKPLTTAQAIKKEQILAAKGHL